MKKVPVQILATIYDKPFKPLRTHIGVEEKGEFSVSVCLADGSFMVEFSTGQTVLFTPEDLAQSAKSALETKPD